MEEMPYFYQLKDALLQKFRERYPYWQESMQAFRGREITQFQELLQEEVGGRVSEKWFYTHLKVKTNKKLPRVDILDLLSQLVGYENWADFVLKHKKREVIAQKKEGRLKIGVVLGIGMAMFCLLFLVLGNVETMFEKTYTFCFVDADLKTPLRDMDIEVHLLKPGESPIIQKANPAGCLTLKTSAKEITFIVKAAYYQPDTVIRKVTSNFQEEIIPLTLDDYALMIHTFSTGKVQDWQKRREQLNGMIAEEAMIFQISQETGLGMELFNKQEFINKLTLPISSLKNIRILETTYDEANRILQLRFVQE